MLITPEILAKMLFRKEYKSFFADIFPSVPERTRRNVMAGKTEPQKKTIDRMISDVCERTGLCEKEFREIFLSDSLQPWKAVFRGLKLGSRKNYPESFDYASEIITRVEAGIFQAGKAKQQGDSHWFNGFKRTGLPSAILPKKFFDAYLFHGAGKKNEKGQNVIPALSGKVFLKTSLYCLAACEVALINSEQRWSEHGLWVHKGLPHYDGDKFIGPMRELFLSIMERVGVSKVPDFSALVPTTDGEYDTDPRQIYRWMKGEEPPCWETLGRIGNELFEGSENFFITCGVMRFLQSLFSDLRINAIPVFFADEQELVSVFQEYPKWQEHHQQAFAKWNETRDPAK